jgi:hypothetical protein
VPKKKFIPQQIIVVQKRAAISKILNSKKKRSKNQIIAILIIKEKSPKVKIFKGQVILFKIGLIKKLIRPRIVPTKIKNCQFSLS